MDATHSQGKGTKRQRGNAEAPPKSVFDQIAERGRVEDLQGVVELIKLMQPEKGMADIGSRFILAGVLGATDDADCLNHFLQLKGLSALEEWLKDVLHRGEVADEFLLALLSALEKLPVDLQALQTCSIGRSVGRLKSHKNREIKSRARGLVEAWMKRVEAEMKGNGAKSEASSSLGQESNGRPRSSTEVILDMPQSQNGKQSIAVSNDGEKNPIEGPQSEKGGYSPPILGDSNQNEIKASPPLEKDEHDRMNLLVGTTIRESSTFDQRPTHTDGEGDPKKREGVHGGIHLARVDFDLNEGPSSDVQMPISDEAYAVQTINAPSLSLDLNEPFEEGLAEEEMNVVDSPWEIESAPNFPGNDGAASNLNDLPWMVNQRGEAKGRAAPPPRPPLSVAEVLRFPARNANSAVEAPTPMLLNRGNNNSPFDYQTDTSKWQFAPTGVSAFTAEASLASVLSPAANFPSGLLPTFPSPPNFQIPSTTPSIGAAAYGEPSSAGPQLLPSQFSRGYDVRPTEGSGDGSPENRVRSIRQSGRRGAGRGR